MKTLFATIIAFKLTIISGLCWSAPRHQAIAIAALQMIKGTPAEAKVNAIAECIKLCPSTKGQLI
jgi:hypothetical protein